MSEAHDCGADAAAYVLGALEHDELERFREHLAGCAICQAEVASLQTAADALPLATPAGRPSSALKRRVMAEVHADSRARRKAMGAMPARRVRLTLGPAAALAVAAAVFAGVELGAGPGRAVKVYQASVGEAQLRVSGGHGELIVHRLTPPRRGRVYELWLQRDGAEPRPANADLTVRASGEGSVSVPGDLVRGTAVLVTEEPAPGTPKPTTQPVVVVRS